MQNKISRRAVVKGGLIAGALIPAMGLMSGEAAAAGLPPLDPKDPTAQALGFVPDATKVDAAAKNAKDFVERDPAGAKQAERVAKRGPRMSVDELVAKGQSVVDRVRRAMSTLRERFAAKNHK